MAAAMTERGDEQRFQEWVCAHGKAVHGFLLAMVRRADVADDLSQEVFCRAWEARKGYVERGSSRAYLLTIADRLVCDRSRRQRPDTNLDEEGWKQNEPPSPTLDPAEAALVAERRVQLAEAMNRLSPIQQRVLLLRYHGQLGFAEIAEITGCPLNTTLSHCRRGLEMLRKVLGKD
jgi:RNA polymerase sigma-70 factor (ECF subfamily)